MRTALRREIEIRSENCTGCQLCRLACSFVKTSSFSLSRSFIDIRRIGGEERYEVGLLPDCDLCGFCVSYCCFGAISRARPSRVPV